jgi:hypothetical protein
MIIDLHREEYNDWLLIIDVKDWGFSRYIGSEMSSYKFLCFRVTHIWDYAA